MMNLVEVLEVRARLVILCVEVLRIETFPPGARAVGFRELAVVGHAGERPSFVGALRGFVPEPGVGSVHAHAESQAVLARRPGPAADDVLFRTDCDRVPRLMRAVPHVEIVVVIRHREEVSRPGPLVERDQCVWIPILCFPGMDHIFEAELAMDGHTV